ncbi:MAG TPA: HEAT repeat domain-containing protein [Pirellula sp.]|nr:HEAT repeat domain-containing protein [Pirellula sp.]
MLGIRAGKKKEVVRIDADWLLGKSTDQIERDISWFPRVYLSLFCILVAVWSWPHASKRWLKWEWQQQLAHFSGPQSEDLPILLALNELDPIRIDEMVQQLGSVNGNRRSVAFHLLDQRVQKWNEKDRPTASELTAIIERLISEQIRIPEGIQLRGQIASRLRPLISREIPDAPKLLASLDRMIIESEPPIPPATPLDSIPTASPIIAESIPQVNSPAAATRFRVHDSSSVAADPIDPPSIRQHPNTASIAATETRPILTSMRTLTDHAETKPVPLPNINYSIPRTVADAALIRTPAVTVELAEDSVQQEPKMIYRTLEPTMINGIDKRQLDQLLPLLTSSQSRIVQQASNELMRRGMTQPQLELAIDLAQGDGEQRLRAMEAIVRDPKLNAIPLLVWMAESGNRDVRRRAIVLLGSMTDPDAMRKLRILQSREPDSAISDQISQVLLASGAAANSVR